MTNKHENTDRAGKTDGRLFQVRNSDLQRGAVIRMGVATEDGSSWSFSDMLITHVRDGLVTMARPFACVSSTGAVYTSIETITVEAARLTSADSSFRAVVSSTGQVDIHVR
jgi:hypothetical protein